MANRLTGLEIVRDMQQGLHEFTFLYRPWKTLASNCLASSF